MKNKLLFLTLFLFVVTPLSGCGNQQKTTFLCEEPAGQDLFEDFAVSDDVSVFEEKDIYVSVQGEVANPGVYLMPSGSRVFELINQAGGVTENADTSGINMVYTLEDGMQIIVPGFVEEDAFIVSKDMTPANADSSSGLVNINTASLNELMTLPGIGETRARAIMDYREKGGHFDTVEDIKNVSGIKNGIYTGLKDSICVK